PPAFHQWHPLNRGVYIASKTMLAGLLLSAKGDRIGMAASVENRYPFLDEAVVDFLARVPPDLKLRGFREKYLLRLAARRWLPPNCGITSSSSPCSLKMSDNARSPTSSAGRSAPTA